MMVGCARRSAGARLAAKMISGTGGRDEVRELLGTRAVLSAGDSPRLRVSAVIHKGRSRPARLLIWVVVATARQSSVLPSPEIEIYPVVWADTVRIPNVLQCLRRKDHGLARTSGVGRLRTDRPDRRSVWPKRCRISRTPRRLVIRKMALR